MGEERASGNPEGLASDLVIHKEKETDFVIALAGNPNVGKSTVFNGLTGMHQHTGNWAGKTVTNAQGHFTFHGKGYVLVDLPGSYSLDARSAEEEGARNFLYFGHPDRVIVVCDASALQRNLNLAFQVMEIQKHTILCVNLMDEAEKRHIHVDIKKLEKELGIPVIPASARSGKGLEALENALELPDDAFHPTPISLSPAMEEGIGELGRSIAPFLPPSMDARWAAARMIDGDPGFRKALTGYLGKDLWAIPEVKAALEAVKAYFETAGYSLENVRDAFIRSRMERAGEVERLAVQRPASGTDTRDRKLDVLFTSRLTGFPIMVLLLLVVFWITIAGANVPSDLLADLFTDLGDWLEQLLIRAGVAPVVISLAVHGVYKVVAWVVSVMLPPMAIFFPLFTLLEDFGYLPRVAFNLDNLFRKCGACGKQALTMCMGFGCNAAGVTGCRIIDSPRERLLAILTNNFVPCNGRFPTIISVITLFLLGNREGWTTSLAGALLLVLVILLGVTLTFLISYGLSKTVLKGVPSSFTLELPPYRQPQFLQVIVRSIFDRTLKVLYRALTAAAPAGLLIWALANLSLHGMTILSLLTSFLDPLGHMMGLDGTILTGFILGLPANEIVMPVIVMTYLQEGSLVGMEGGALSNLLINNGWTWGTAVCVILFSLLHWPCATTLLTIHHETGSLRWTALAFLLPTACGFILCLLANLVLQW